MKRFVISAVALLVALPVGAQVLAQRTEPVDTSAIQRPSYRETLQGARKIQGLQVGETSVPITGSAFQSSVKETDDTYIYNLQKKLLEKDQIIAALKLQCSADGKTPVVEGVVGSQPVEGVVLNTPPVNQQIVNPQQVQVTTPDQPLIQLNPQSQQILNQQPLISVQPTGQNLNPQGGTQPTTPEPTPEQTSPQKQCIVQVPQACQGLTASIQGVTSTRGSGGISTQTLGSSAVGVDINACNQAFNQRINELATRPECANVVGAMRSLQAITLAQLQDAATAQAEADARRRAEQVALAAKLAKEAEEKLARFESGKASAVNAIRASADDLFATLEQLRIRYRRMESTQVKPAIISFNNLLVKEELLPSDPILSILPSIGSRAKVGEQKAIDEMLRIRQWFDEVILRLDAVQTEAEIEIILKDMILEHREIVRRMSVECEALNQELLLKIREGVARSLELTKSLNR
jgi:hypothetical protein